MLGGDQNCTQTHTQTDTHTHTHTHRQTHTQTDTHTHTHRQTQTHTHTEAYFISLVFLRKCRNKTKKINHDDDADIGQDSDRACSLQMTLLRLLLANKL